MITEHNIEEKIDEALAHRDGLLAALRAATDPAIRRTLEAQLSLAAEYIDFLMSDAATKTEDDADHPLLPWMRRALEEEIK